MKIDDGARHIGTVKQFNPGTGYGFLRFEGEEADVFVHYSEVMMDGYRMLVAGQSVECNVRSGAQGLEAYAVRLVKEGG